MALAATAYAKAHFRRRMMAVSTSIGPGCTNLVTAAAVAHVNRLPMLLLPGDVFISRAPDPVLQQVEDFQDGGVSAVDCLRPVSRYFDRIVVPSQLLTALPRAIATLTDPAQCGPVTLALPQDVQAQAFDWPEAFFAERDIHFRQPPPNPPSWRLWPAAASGQAPAHRVRWRGAVQRGRCDALQQFVERHGIPVGESQAGKGALSWDHPLLAGSIGVTGSPAANELAEQADLVLAVGSRLQDFTTGSHTLYAQATLLSINVNGFDAIKWGGHSLQCDAAVGLAALSAALEGWQADADWTAHSQRLCNGWRGRWTRLCAARVPACPPMPRPSVRCRPRQRIRPSATSWCALPVRCRPSCTSCGAPVRRVVITWSTAFPAWVTKWPVAWGENGPARARSHRDGGRWQLFDAEQRAGHSVMLGHKIIVVLLDNAGYACINRLQQACGGAPFNNMLADCLHGEHGIPQIDFAQNARSLGAEAETVGSVAELLAAMVRARAASRSYLIQLRIDGPQCTPEGGSWWEVGIPEVSEREAVRSARADYEQARLRQAPQLHI
jgi:3D-(3,5/4)-trihydroxycyclohexane-1,2-dione acylhydrolase (decyclizing)